MSFESRRRDHSLSCSDNDSESDVESKKISLNNSLKPDIKPSLIDDTYKEFVGLPFLQASEIGDDDEIWLLQCPMNVDATQLCSKKLIVGGQCSIKLKLPQGRRQRLEVTSENADLDITCLLQNHKKIQAVPLQIKGKLFITENFEEHDDSSFSFYEQTDLDETVPLPEGLILRHPLFGADFSKRLSGGFTPTPQKKKKKKHSKEKKQIAEISYIQESVIIKEEIDSEITSNENELEVAETKSKRKKKHHNDEEVCQSPRKSKKRHHEENENTSICSKKIKIEDAVVVLEENGKHAKKHKKSIQKKGTSPL